MPTLNEARQQLFSATGQSFLKPYANWAEFAVGLKNPISVVNFIAAYGTHALLTEATTLEAKRAVAWELVFGVEADGVTPSDIADRLAFINGTGIYAANKGGLDHVDFWIGGLAEKILLFGGMLGSTFTAVFEAQMEALQDADRFYYLTRTQGLNFLDQLENNAFSKLIMANTDLTEPGPDGIRGTEDDVIKHHIGIDAFGKYDLILEADLQYQQDYNGAAPGKDPNDIDAVLAGLGFTQVNRGYASLGTMPIAFAGYYDTYLRFLGGEHVVLGGTSGNDVLIGDLGDDAIWGGAGNDYIEGGQGVDLITGGYGDDIILDEGDEGDFIKGDDGNDVIASSNGLDILMGGAGKDVIFAGKDDTEVFGGEGDDFILGGDGVDFLLGNEGDDWIEAGGGFDTTAGDNSELFFNSTILGHDVMFAGSEEHDFDGESGDDIMVQGESVMRNEGMFGFDWVSYQGAQFNADADMRIRIFTTDEADILRNRFDKVEALSGGDGNDILRGDDRVAGVAPPVATANNTEGMFFNDELSEAGLGRIEGLRELLGNLVAGVPVSDSEINVAFTGGNILLGGGGSDTLQGNGGNDFIDGNARLNVRIRLTAPDAANTAANEIGTIYTLKHVFTAQELVALGLDPTLAGKSLFELLIIRAIVPSQMHIVREIIADDGHANDVDIAVYNDTFFGADGTPNYTITSNDDGTVTIAHITVSNAIDPVTGRQLVSDGVDTLRNIEIARFRDVDIRLDNAAPTDIRWIGVVPANSALPGNNTVIAALQAVDEDSTVITFSLQPGSSAGFTVSATGVVTKTGAAMAAGQTYTLIIRATDDFGNTRDETFTIVTGTDGNNTINVSANTNDTIVYGEDGNDTITGGSGNDTLFGQDEDDILDGGLGDDVLHGGLGDSDTASYASASGGVTVNLAAGTATGAAGNDTLIDIENVTGSGFDDTLVGNGGANILNGGNGNDTLNGGAGNDTLNGGAGNDTYVFGTNDGNDSIQETSGSDTLAVVAGAALTHLNFAEGGGGNLDIEIGATAVTVVDHYDTVGEELETVTFDAGTSIAGYALTGSYAMSADDVGNRDALAGVATILAGSTGNNTLNGSTNNDLLFGGAGADTLNGGDGNDLLVGGTGNDTINGGGGNDTILYRMGDGADTVSGGTGTDTLAVMDPGTGNNTLDVVFNGTRITTLEGGTVNADVENVTADLGAGTDTLAYSATSSAVTVNLATGTASGFASVTGIENVTGTNNADTFTGNAANNVFNGGAGTDTLVLAGAAGTHLFGVNGGNVTVAAGDGSQGTDTLQSIELVRIGGVDHTLVFNGTGNQGQTVSGGTGGQDGRADLILGFGGNDTLNGNGGNDILYGGAGNDTLNGGAGNDRIVWTVGDGRDFADGGTGTDTMHVLGNATAETYNIYTRTAWLAVAGNTIGQLNDNTEIIIARGGTNNAAIIAELDNIEEIVIDGMGGGDTFNAVGNFGTTSLLTSTITLNGGSGDDTVDFSALSSAHRIIFRSNGGNDTIVGNVRPQDVIELAPGEDVSSYTLVNNGNGTHTYSNGTHSITFTGAVPPQFQNGTSTGGTHLDKEDFEDLLDMVRDPNFARDSSGYGNNVDNPGWGAAGHQFIRLTEAHYTDGASGIRQTALTPRDISNILSNQDNDGDGIEESIVNAFGGTSLLTFFGQYFDHGLDFVAKGEPGSVYIGNVGATPVNAPRSNIVPGTGVDGIPAQYINHTSPYVDQNQAYGSHDAVTDLLRRWEVGSNGEAVQTAYLLTGATDASGHALLPTLSHIRDNYRIMTGGNELTSEDIGNYDGTGNALLIDFIPKFVLLEDGSPSEELDLDQIGHFFVSGDGRANENVMLTSIHTIWARNHNFWVNEIKAQTNNAWTESEYFEAARMMNIAEYQRVVFTEFATAMAGGFDNDDDHGFEGYDPNVDASISVEFAQAAYRFGHSMLNETVSYVDANGDLQEISLVQAFLSPNKLSELGIDALIGGAVQVQHQAIDVDVVNALRNQLVGRPLDLAALNIFRGRDMGIAPFNTVRTQLYEQTNLTALRPYTGWADFALRNGISAEMLAKLQMAYPDGFDTMDLWIGGLLEKPMAGQLGSTFGYIFLEQLHRLQHGDRLYYLEIFDDSLFTDENSITFAKIIERNTGLTGLPENVFDLDGSNAPADDDDSIFNQHDDDDDDSVGQDDDDDDDDTVGHDDDDDDDDVDDDDDDDDGVDDDDDAPPPVHPGHVVGTPQDDMLFGSAGGDLIFGFAGTDYIVAGAGADVVRAGSGNDFIDGGAGRDVLFGEDGNDDMFGGDDDDMLYGGAGDDRMFGGNGNDLLDGGDGNDTVFGGAGNDMFVASLNDGNDTYYGGDISSDTGNDTLDMGFLTVDAVVDLGTGVGGRGSAVSSQSGTDTLWGIENVTTGSGNDTIIMSNAVNIVDGGQGQDVFVFGSAAAANGDTIRGFETGDKIDLSGIDANTGTVGNDTFTLESGQTATAPGQIVITHETREDGEYTVISGNTSGDNAPEFRINIAGNHALTADDFNL